MVSSVIILIVLCLFALMIILVTLLTNAAISKTNFLYLIPIVIICTCIYSIGYQYEYGYYDFYAFASCLRAGVKSFGFEMTESYAKNLAENDIIYKIDLYAATILAGLSLISSLLYFIKSLITNIARFLHRLLFKSSDLVIGNSEEAIEFVKKNKHAILLIDQSFTGDFDSKAKEKLVALKIPYFKLKLNAKNLRKLLLPTKGKIDIFVFEPNADKIQLAINLIEETSSLLGEKKLRKNSNKESFSIHFHVLANRRNLLFVNKQLTQACKNKSSAREVVASAFDEYGLIGRNFSKTHNFAMYLPDAFIKNGVLQDEKHIHVVMIGFGKSAEAVLEASILNNQFVKIKDGKYVAEPIHYHLYDPNENAFKKKIVSQFETEYPKYVKPENSLPDIELVAKIEHETCVFPSDFLKLPKFSENDFVFYFVSVGEPIDNLTLVNYLLERSIDAKNSVIFYCADSKEEEMKFSCKARIFPFGFKNDVFSKKNIVDDVYNQSAMSVNDAYNARNAGKQNFTTLDIVEKLSNFYSTLNLEFKLNLLGFTFDDKSMEKVTKEEFLEAYKEGKEHVSYDDYFKLSTKNALLYQEHLRWATYYYMNGFNPMSLEEIAIDEKGDCQHKDIENRKHACLTSFDGLDQLHRFEAQKKAEKSDISFEDALKEKETYKYDLMNLDEIATTFARPIYKLLK